MNNTLREHLLRPGGALGERVGRVKAVTAARDDMGLRERGVYGEVPANLKITLSTPQGGGSSHCSSHSQKS